MANLFGEKDTQTADDVIEIPSNFDAQVEAVVFSADRPLSAIQICKALQIKGAAAHVLQAIDRLNQQYADTGRCFRIEAIAGTLRAVNLPEFADVMDGLKNNRGHQKLSAAAIETLSIIAYRQPVMRADIENIRGVACGEVLRSLLERHLIKIVGRAEQIGRPVLYGTSKTFLEVFGLDSIKHLPKVEGENPMLRIRDTSNG